MHDLSPLTSRGEDSPLWLQVVPGRFTWVPSRSRLIRARYTKFLVPGAEVTVCKLSYATPEKLAFRGAKCGVGCLSCNGLETHHRGSHIPPTVGVLVGVDARGGLAA